MRTLFFPLKNNLSSLISLNQFKLRMHPFTFVLLSCHLTSLSHSMTLFHAYQCEFLTVVANPKKKNKKHIQFEAPNFELRPYVLSHRDNRVKEINVTRYRRSSACHFRGSHVIAVAYLHSVATPIKWCVVHFCHSFISYKMRHNIFR